MKNTEVEKIHYWSALVGQLGWSKNSRSHLKNINWCWWWWNENDDIMTKRQWQNDNDDDDKTITPMTNQWWQQWWHNDYEKPTITKKVQLMLLSSLSSFHFHCRLIFMLSLSSWHWHHWHRHCVIVLTLSSKSYHWNIVIIVILSSYLVSVIF